MAATIMTVRPSGPAKVAVASASGVTLGCASSGPWIPSATHWMARYSAVAAPSARKDAIGTVREGERTSPLGTNATSMPVKAISRHRRCRTLVVRDSVTSRCRLAG